MAFLALRAHGKINLYLDVIGRRADGYHDLITVFQSIGLHDRIAFAEGGYDIKLEVTGAELETGGENLVMLAARLLRSYSGAEHGVRIALEKRIPVGAGLGGGSTDAAATLVGLNRLWNLGLTSEELHELALQLGMDVPFCLRGGTALAAGRGEIMERVDLTILPWVVLAYPGFQVSTAWAYRAFDENQSARNTRAHRTTAEDVRTRLQRSDLTWCLNRFEEVVFEEFPQLRELANNMKSAGAEAVLLCGSGSAICGLSNSFGEALKVYRRVAGGTLRVFLTHAVGASPTNLVL